jgi:hypothetical protein
MAGEYKPRCATKSKHINKMAGKGAHFKSTGLLEHDDDIHTRHGIDPGDTALKWCAVRNSTG